MDSHIPHRGYSFTHHDEDALRSQNHQQHQYAQPYRDTGYQVSPIEMNTPVSLQGYDASPPPPPAHRSVPGRKPVSHTANLSQSPPSQRAAYLPSQSNTYAGGPRRESLTTPGMDNLGETAAGGGIAGIALGIANTNERESGLQALRDIDNWGRPSGQSGMASGPAERRYDQNAYEPSYPSNGPIHRQGLDSHGSSSSNVPLAAAAIPPGLAANYADHRPSPDRYFNGNGHMYTDSPYSRHNSSQDRLATGMAAIDPMDIEDDGDDGIGMTTKPQEPKRKSILGLGRPGSTGNAVPKAAAAGVAGGAAASSIFSGFGNRDTSGQYGPVPGGASASSSTGHEKSEWLNRQTKGNRKLKWIVGTIVAIVLVAGIVGGIIGGILSSRKNHDSSPSRGQSAADDDGKGDLSKDSSEIKALLNNPNLHRVFPGMDYTPLNAQYPLCLTSPPSQNNITRDMAVLSQLTNRVRLYGTDCNQTEMVLHAIDRLALTDMKVWLGVWLDNNQTTSDRQMAQMWSILDKHGADPFAGVIIGNEVLFRKQLTADQMGKILTDAKSNLTRNNMDLPVATSDLGDAWSRNPALARNVDVVMSNIHPFFGGVKVSEAAGWTWDFWQNNDAVLTAGTSKKQVVSEVGWPSEGGNDCAPAETCPDKTSGAVAGIDEMNLFMNDWVCQSLANKTEYFWFEAFDEPWKTKYNIGDRNWEDKWGLMDVNRNLKKGVKIPDCGGQTV